MPLRIVLAIAVLGCWPGHWSNCPGQDLQPLRYGSSEPVDLGVGLWAWPLPMDYDGDGDYDLVVSCPDKPYNGTYFFENRDNRGVMPVFEPALKIGPGLQNLRVSYVAGKPRVLGPAAEFTKFLSKGTTESTKLPLPVNVHTPGHKIRMNAWHYVDYDGDDALDVIVGVDDWHDYGWDDGYDAKGNWLKGPLHGYVYLLRNEGTTDSPRYAAPKLVEAAGKPVDVFGYPSPNFADFDGDGDLDLLCGEFLDRFTYFQNTGSRKEPRYASGRFLQHAGKPLTMDLEMIVPSAIDWDWDGDVDLIVGDEDGRVAFVEHTGRVDDGLPRFSPPRYFQQQPSYVKCGALATPVAVDWDGDGDQDIVSGNTAGYIEFFENLGRDVQSLPSWSAPRKLAADGKIIRIQAGPNGSIQGPCEAKWGYSTLSAADWNHDSRIDLVVNSIWGEVVWYENSAESGMPVLKAAQRVEVEWPGETPKPAWTWWKPQGKQLVTQWRTTPVVWDANGDGLHDLVMLDPEGYLALYARRKTADGLLQLLPGERVFVDETNQPLRMNAGVNGKSGRRKLHAADWDGDGRIDLLANGANAEWLRNVETRDGRIVLKNMGPLAKTNLAAHDTSPSVARFGSEEMPDLIIGAEDGHIYFLRRGDALK